MKISMINSGVSFARDIKFIDAHTHDKSLDRLGKSAVVSEVTKFLKPFSTETDTFIPQKIFPSALDCCLYVLGDPYADEISGNKQIIEAFGGTEVDKFIAVCQPKTGSVKNIKKLFKEYKDKIIGLKFHPNGAELAADDKLYDSYLNFASKKGLPCLFHSDRTFDKVYIGADGRNHPALKSEFSRPEQIYELAKRHPDVPVIMANFGGPEKEDIDATLKVMKDSIKNGDAKLYADISWMGIDDYIPGTQSRTMRKLVDVINELKNTEQGDMTDRILFGTDAPIARFDSAEAEKIYHAKAEKIYQDYIIDIHSAIKKNFPDEADELTDKIFYKNAEKLFFSEKQNIAHSGKNFVKKLPIIAIAAAAVVGLTFLGVKLYKKNKLQNPTQTPKNVYVC